MTTKKKAVDAVSAGNVASGPVTVNPVTPGSAAAGTTTQGQTQLGKTRLPAGLLKELQDVLQGIQKDIPDGSSLTAVNGTYAKATMVSTLQSTLALYAAVSAQETALKQARLTLTAAIPGARQYYAELKGVITGFFHAGNPMLVDFGFKPKKAPAARTVATMSAAVVRNEQTRIIRGTKGPKAKLALKYLGPVTGASAPVAESGAAPQQAQSAAQQPPAKPAGQ